MCSWLSISESFSTVPGSNESDLRTLYCAFAISSMLNDWSAVDVPRALAFVATCRVRLWPQGLERLVDVMSCRPMKVDMDSPLFAKPRVRGFVLCWTPNSYVVTRGDYIHCDCFASASIDHPL